jgi:dihydrofolate reductase
MAKHRVIGRGGQLPWRLPEDLAWFKEATQGGILVMGRKTWESIGRPLPGRETFVLSRTPREIPGVHSFSDLAVLDKLATDKTLWIAGGAEIYRLMLPRCGELLLTRVLREVEGDTFFPAFEDDFRLAETLRETPDFRIERWLRS